MAKLKIISEKGSGETFELNAPKISIGRDATSEITLNDASVSRYHCVIEQRGEDFFISDLGSLNGTSVNAEEARDTKLSNGDKVIVGYFTFRFFTDDAADETSGVFLDKTELRLPKNSVQLRIEEVFGAMARDLTAILQIITKINAIRETGALQNELLKQIFEVVPADEGAILLVDDQNEFAEIAGLNRLDETASINVSQTITRQVLETKQVILVTDFEREEENLPEAESLFLRKISSLLCVPVTLFEKTLGVIYL